MHLRLIHLIDILLLFITTEARRYVNKAAMKCAVTSQLGSENGSRFDWLEFIIYENGSKSFHSPDATKKLPDKNRKYLCSKASGPMTGGESFYGECTKKKYAQSPSAYLKVRTQHGTYESHDTSGLFLTKEENRMGWCIKDEKNDQVLAACWIGVAKKKSSSVVSKMGSPSRESICCVPGHHCGTNRQLEISSNTTSANLRGGLTITEFEAIDGYADAEEVDKDYYKEEGAREEIIFYHAEQ